MNKIRINIDKEPGNIPIQTLDLTKYFKPNQKCWVDIWACARHDYNDWGCESRKAYVDVQGEEIDVVEVNTNSMILECSLDYLETDNGNPLFNRAITTNGGPGFIVGSNVRGVCANPPGCTNVTDRLVFMYKLVANKIPEDENGGGLRVKSITLNDENNNRYKTRYYYNVPGTGNEKSHSTYKSSGITSYSPVKGTKFVPYQSQLPSPGVMYEYVTMVPQDANGNDIGSTRYSFYTLKPVKNIFDENIVMKDDDGTTIFKASVVDHNSQEVNTIVGYEENDFGQTVPIYEKNYYLNSSKKIKAKSIKLDVNTSLIGQFKSIEEFNKHGQLLSKIEKKYLSGYELKSRADLPNGNINQVNRGSISESFQSMKSVFKTSSSDNDPVLKNRFLSVSTKEEYTSVLQSITTTGVHGKTVESYSKTDPATGAFMIVEKE